MTAQEIIAQAYKNQPELKLAYSKDGAAIGAWDTSKGRYVMVAGRTITEGQPWLNMPYELLKNGQPPVKAEDWVPCPPSEVLC